MRARPVWRSLAAVAVIGWAPLACESLPGTRTQQSTAIGGAAGAATGAAVAGEGNRLLGALLGGAIGAAGGYLIGAQTDWFARTDGDDAALRSIEDARRDPATVSDALSASTADLNDDGFVTTDELVAMERAGLSDSEIISRLRATGQIFELTSEQEASLIRAGVSRNVVNAMPEINQDARRRLLSDSDVLGRKPRP